MESESALWFTLLLIFLFSGFIREFFVRKNILSLTEVKNFLNHSPITSRDDEHDSNVRRKLYRNIRIACIASISLVSICQLSGPILMSQQNKYYRIPYILQSMGPATASVLQACYVMTIFPLWINKVFGPTIFVSAIMLGLQNEYGISARGLGDFVNRLRTDFLLGDIYTKNHCKVAWDLLHQQLLFQINQHLLLTK